MGKTRWLDAAIVTRDICLCVWGLFLNAAWNAVPSPHEVGGTLRWLDALIWHDVSSCSKQCAIHWAYKALALWWPKSLLKITSCSLSMCWIWLSPDQIIDLDHTVFLRRITWRILPLLDAHWCPVTLVVLINGKLSIANWTHITATTNWSYCCSSIGCTVIGKTQLCLTMETSVLANINLRSHINWILPSHLEIFFLCLIYRLVSVFNNPNVTLFIHKWLSALKTFFEIRIERLFSNNVGNPIKLLLLSFLILRWQLIAINSVEWPLCVIFRLLNRLMRSYQFRLRLVVLIVLFTQVYSLNLLDCLLFFWILFAAFIFNGGQLRLHMLFSHIFSENQALIIIIIHFWYLI